MYLLMSLLTVFAADTAGVLAEKVTAGGHTRPPYHLPHGVRIMRDGTVTHFDERFKTTEKVATIEPSILKKLTAIIDADFDTKMYDPKAGDPECSDAPVTLYTVQRSNGETVKIGRNANCHEERVLVAGLQTLATFLDSTEDLGD